jgi:hypothetical protein
MRKLLLIIVFIFTVTVVFAERDPLVLQKKSSNIPLVELLQGDRLIVSLLHDQWFLFPDNINVSVFQPGFGLQAMYPFTKNHVGIALGFSLSSHNFYSDAMPRNIPYKDDEGVLQDYTGFTPFDSLTSSMDAFSYKKNKLNVTYIELPVEFRFAPGEEKKWRFAAGFKFGMLISDHTKYKGDDYRYFSESQIKEKRFNIPYIAKIKYGPTLRINYGKFSISCYYPLVPLFESNRGPEMYPVTFGIGYAVL